MKMVPFLHFFFLEICDILKEVLWYMGGIIVCAIISLSSFNLGLIMKRKKQEYKLFLFNHVKSVGIRQDKTLQRL